MDSCKFYCIDTRYNQAAKGYDRKINRQTEDWGNERHVSNGNDAKLI